MSQDAKDVELFKNLHQKGLLLRPEQPGIVPARLVLDCPGDLSGHFLTWNDDASAAFHDE